MTKNILEEICKQKMKFASELRNKFKYVGHWNDTIRELEDKNFFVNFKKKNRK